ncbi:conserved hypothetical protein [Candidatus Sulfotelmatobacter kueseliae]|uniref:Uncharacterized protein n=1 Tax=Candidatus Sulfotelmatobacter kueseliae TaxID=2042962 RepID=A0A2U3KJ49_9BACT|nr:conserved hypothetical protein [Candidatus Sulfotelmatobacter kueseliae]
MQDKLPEISNEKQKLFSRIKRLGGQITAVERAVAEGDECADILMLLAAIRGGVNSLMAEILEDHIRLHITHPDPGTDSPEELTEDLISLVRAEPALSEAEGSVRATDKIKKDSPEPPRLSLKPSRLEGQLDGSSVPRGCCTVIAGP